MIWIVGSSLIKKAFTHVKTRPLGDNLGLESYGYNVIWVGHPGLSFTQVYGICQALKNSSMNRFPAYIIVHAGGNDIGSIRARDLRNFIKQTITNLIALFPNSCIVWSSILPRLRWRYSENTEAMENIRTRTNRAIIKHMGQNDGKAIKHPDFNDKHPGLYEDSCHLSFIGNDIFVNTFQGALFTFISYPEVMVYPLDS